MDFLDIMNIVDITHIIVNSVPVPTEYIPNRLHPDPLLSEKSYLDPEGVCAILLRSV
jgi:hypothetical protein